jgi:hypothetical protein
LGRGSVLCYVSLSSTLTSPHAMQWDGIQNSGLATSCSKALTPARVGFICT